MKAFVETPIMQKQVVDIRCNSCGRDVIKNSFGYFEDHVALSKTWGYHSPYDGEAHAIDLCVGCYQNWVNQFEIPPSVEGNVFAMQ